MVSSAVTANQLDKAMEKVTKKALRSKRAAREFLHRAGIATKDGKLAKPYR